MQAQAPNLDGNFLAYWQLPQGVMAIYHHQQGVEAKLHDHHNKCIVFEKVIGWIGKDQFTAGVDPQSVYQRMQPFVIDKRTILLCLYQRVEQVGEQSLQLIVSLSEIQLELRVKRGARFEKISFAKLTNLDPSFQQATRSISLDLFERLAKLAYWQIRMVGDKFRFVLPDHKVCVYFPEQGESLYFDVPHTKNVKELQSALPLKYAASATLQVGYSTEKIDGRRTIGDCLQDQVEFSFFRYLPKAQQHITVFYRREKYELPIGDNSTIEDILLRFELILGSSKDERRLMCDGIDHLWSSGRLRDCGICTGDTLHLRDICLTGGGMLFEFREDVVQASKEVVKPAQESGKAWRAIKPGLNVKGICLNPSCQAYKQEMIVPKGFGTFDVQELNEITQCILCAQRVSAVTNLSFFKCIYSIDSGIKGGVKGIRKGRAPDDKVITFIENDRASKLRKFSYLLLTVEEIEEEEDICSVQ